MPKIKFKGRNIGDEWSVSQDELPSYLDYDLTRLGDNCKLAIRPGLLPAMLHNVESRLYWKSNEPKDLLDCIVESQKILQLKVQQWPPSGWIVLHPDVLAFIMRHSGVDESDILKNITLNEDMRIFEACRLFGWDVYGYRQFPREEILLGVRESDPYARITLDLSVKQNNFSRR